jgi:hypothetical protein
VDQGNSFRKAKRILRQHYQHIVIHDFLKEQIADKQIVEDTIQNGSRVYDPDDDDFFLPLEFSVAAYRFGHSMVRGGYNFNLNFNFSNEPGPNGFTVRATFDLLFTFTALSGQLGEFDTLPENWIIEWENFFEGGQFSNPARRIDTKLVDPLQKLRDETGQQLVDSPTDTEGRISASLAVRNLLRGYLLRMPTGQAVAARFRRSLTEYARYQRSPRTRSGRPRRARIRSGYSRMVDSWSARLSGITSWPKHQPSLTAKNWGRSAAR